MIRFLIGCLLAIAVLWAATFTLGAFLMGFTKDAVHRPVQRQLPR